MWLPSFPWRNRVGSRVLRVVLYSTETLPPSSSTANRNDSLHSRISRAGNPRVSIVPVLQQWLDEGRDIKQSELQKSIKVLRHYRRYSHALQISEWMSDQRNHDISTADMAVRLDLISKVHGIDEADKYFNGIPDSLRGLQVYGALLNCYAHNKSLEKAEVTMQKMRELGFVKNSLSYNVMLNLYSQMEKHEKLDVLMQEMEEKGIKCDEFTFNIRLNAYVATSDIEGMEKLLMKMEACSPACLNWHAYVVVANGYLKAGLIEKTLLALKRLEQLIPVNSKRSAYEFLLTLYTATGQKEELYRIWNLYKKMGKFFNSGYLCMINALVKLDDIDGAVRIFLEWESKKTVSDFRIPIMLIGAFSKRGLLEKAEVYINRHVQSGSKGEAAAWDILATGYRIGGQMSKAVDTMKKAILASEQGWKPNLHTWAACLEFLKGQGDGEAAAELLKLVEEQGNIPTHIWNEFVKKINSGDLGFQGS